MNAIILEDLDRILAAPLPWESLAGKTALVTGAGGFLPSWIVFALARLNDQGRGPPCRIIGLARSRDRASVRLGPLLGRPDLRLAQHDLSQPLPDDFLEGQRPDIIIHAASAAAPKAFLADPVGVMKANIFGAGALLDLARSRGCDRFLFLSSGEVHGETGDRRLDETVFGGVDPATLRACYGEAKRATETLLVAYARQYGVETRIARPLHTYGPMIDLEDGRVFSDFIADILTGRDLVLKSDGAARRPFCYAADAVLGFFTVLLQGERATPYIVGNDEAFVSIADLARILTREAFPDLGLHYRLGPASDLSSPITGSPPDTSRLRALGWSPRTDIVEGFRRTVASFRATKDQRR